MQQNTFILFLQRIVHVYRLYIATTIIHKAKPMRGHLVYAHRVLMNYSYPSPKLTLLAELLVSLQFFYDCRSSMLCFSLMIRVVVRL